MIEKNLKATFDTVKNCIVDIKPATQKEFWHNELTRLANKEDLNYDDLIYLRDDIELNCDKEDRICIEEQFFSEDEDTPSTIEMIKVLLKHLKIYEKNQSIINQINYILGLI